MSLISDLMGTAIGIQAQVHGSVVVEYYNGAAWVAIADAIWHERTGIPLQDEDRDQEYFTRLGTLTYPITGPALAYRGKIRIATEEFVLTQKDTVVSQRRWTAERRELIKSTPNRGAI